MGRYKLISSDSHIIEPPDLWQKRIEPRFRDRAPYLVREEDTDQWYVDGNVKFARMGVSTQAGLRFERPEDQTPEGRLEDIFPGAMDPHQHVKDMDLDEVSVGLLYPTQALDLIMVLPDSELLSALCRTYNEWLADFCQPYPDRLKGIGMVNVDDVDDAVGELQRVAKLGLVGALISIRPMEKRYDHPDYEPLWSAAQDLDMVLSLHTGTARWRPGGTPIVNIKTLHGDPVESANKDYPVRTSLGAMIFSGVFERYPRLKVGVVEFEASWALYFLRNIDNVYAERLSGLRGTRFKGNTQPSDFFRSNVFISFQEDELAVQLRSTIGVNNLLWGSDYPHVESTFPKSQEIVARILEGVPEDEAAKIAGGNTARIYHFD